VIVEERFRRRDDLVKAECDHELTIYSPTGPKDCDMRPEVVRCLRCPVCHGPLSLPTEARAPLSCPLRHSFDQSRQGYVQLTAAPLVHGGDSPAMVAARAEFLTAGHYSMITAALGRAAAAYHPGGLVLDLGAGTGHHLAGVLDALPPDTFGLATDVSKAAVKVAARAHPRADAVVCDAWQPMPLADGVVGLALDVFAPRPGAEFARVLRRDGVLLVVIPTSDHLHELVAPLGLLTVDPAKTDRVAAQLDPLFTTIAREPVRGTMTLTHTEVATLVGMGPSARHITPADLADRIAALPRQTAVTLSTTLATYRPTSG
jgi:23S rRNA (guanine745-N1)-methyltransferase